MPDTLTIVADTLRTLMGATAADPYIKVIERNVAEASIPSFDEIAGPLIGKLSDCMDPDNAREFVTQTIREATERNCAVEELREIQTRSEAAHAYASKYLLPDGWGKIVWHAILDDAIRLRRTR